EHPQSLIALCGCYAQVAAAQLMQLPELDIVAGVEERAKLPQLVMEKLAAGKGQVLDAAAPLRAGQTFTLIAAVSEQKRARAYLKIEDGCAEFCNYCIVPYARGPARSLPQEQALRQGATLVNQGHREIVVSGVHIGAYGRDLQDGSSLPGLICALAALPGLQRLRLGSIEPQQFTAEILTMLRTQGKICHQLHIPLQSGCDRTLQAMGRKYLSADYAKLVAELRQIYADVAITTDIMVGYPGETTADFAQSRQFCEQIGFARMHVFPYSPRPGTPAAVLPQLSREEKKRRATLMGETARSLASRYGKRFIGSRLLLLPEQIEQRGEQWYLWGHSDNYLPLGLPISQPAFPEGGELLPVVGVKWVEEGLLVAPAAD
ncbi:MAG: MiaB/RimO family radical SAM methylthiotransferase, partial [Clostridiales bacterium]